MTAKQVAASLRATLKTAGVRARVRMTPGTSDSVQVNVPTFDARFTDEEQRAIRQAAVELGLTHVRGLSIRVDQATVGMGDTYYLPWA